MKILFLDDSPRRHAVFKNRASDHDVTYVWTASEAIEALKTGGFDYVFLDHDLGEFKNGEELGFDEAMSEKESAGDGFQVASFIAEHMYKKYVAIQSHYSFP